MPRLAVLSLALIASPALAQDGAFPADDAEAEERLAQIRGEILVVATRLRGAVDAPQAPVATFDEADIAAYGAGSLADLIAAVSPQTGSGRGRGGGGGHLILINGQRIANFREMRNFAPEAVRRMEVLPEEVALRYGFPPNARVINFILKDNYYSTSVDAELHWPRRGGFAEDQFEASYLKIDKASRFNLNGRANNASILTEAERGVIQQPGSEPTVSGDPDPAQFRSLVDDTRDYALNASWTTGLGEANSGASLSLSGGFQRNDALALSGLNTVLLTAPGGATALRTLPGALERRSRVETFSAGSALNQPMGSWQLSATIDASHATSTSLIDRRADTSALITAASAGTLAINAALPPLVSGVTDRARSQSESLASLATLTGRLLALPGGDLSLTLKAGFGHTGIRSEDTRTTTGPVRLKRGDLSAGVNLGVPIASRRDNVLAGLGDLSLNFSAGLNRLSDFGTLKDWSAGLTWTPVEGLGLQASYLVNEAAPSLGNLGNPRILTFNVPVFDFTRGETALVTVTSGGNPALRREQQRDVKLGANWTLPFLSNSRLVVEYFRNRSDDVTSGFPVLTPEIEAAFPDRVTRDGAGRLVAIDRRPVTFADTHGSRLRWGINVSGNLGKAPPQGPGPIGALGRPGGRPGGPGGPGGPQHGAGGPGGGAPGLRGGGGGGAMMRMIGGGGGRWNLSLYHTVRFEERVRIAPGVPALDLLGGDATSSTGVARHALEFEGGGFYRGFGLRFNGNWAAPTRVDDLRFGSVLRVDLRAFVDFDRQARVLKAVPFLKGTRLALEIENVLDSRQRVTDGTGATPLSYQLDYLDPRGRVIGIDLRKMF